MRYVLSLLFLFSLAAAADGAIIIQHQGNTSPSSEGWVHTLGVLGYPTADAWRTETNGYAKWQGYLGVTDHMGDWSLEVEARWLDGATAQSRATIFDGYHAKSTAFTWDFYNAYYYRKNGGDTPMPGVDPKVYNTYVINYHGDTGYMDILANGNLIEAMPPSEVNDINPGQYLLYWGDNAGGVSHSMMDWREVTFRDELWTAPPPPPPGPGTIPEPASGAIMLGLMGLAWVWRRKR